MRTACRASMSLALLSAGLLAGHASAQSRLELQAGRSYMDSHGANTAFLEAIGECRPVGSSPLDWTPVFSLGWIDGRDIGRYDHARYGTHRSTELFAAGARWQLHRADAWYRGVYAGFQLAYNHQATQALSSHYQFVSSLGWQGERLSFQLRHISNGGLHHPNRGETMALVGAGFSL